MKNIEQEIRDLESQITRKIELEEKIPQLEKEKSQLSQQVSQLEIIKDTEQKDVDKLESGGLGAIFHKLMGNMDEKLDKERQEAQDAMDNFNSAYQQLQDLDAQLQKNSDELEKIKDCQTRYSQVMEENIKLLEHSAQAQRGEPLDSLLSKLLQLERNRKSLREALLHAQLALHVSEKNMRTLEQARQWARTDPESGDSAQAETSKQECLAIADYYAENLLEEITLLQRKLAQMGIDPEPHLTIFDYLKAPAAFIIGFATDFSQLDRINKAIDQITDSQQQINEISAKMNEILYQIENSIAVLRLEYEDNAD